MSDDTTDDRLDDLRETAEAVGRLADDKAAFGRAVEAFRAQDVDAFRDVLGRFDLLDRCHLICRWLCSKHCVFVCFKLAGPVREAPAELPIEEVRRFAKVVGRSRRTRRCSSGWSTSSTARTPRASRPS